jgi:hypothetical protein
VTRSWLPPEPPRAHPGWAVASIVAHVAAVAVLFLISGRETRDATVTYIVLDRAPERVVYYDMAYATGPGGGGDGPAVGTGASRAQAPAAPAEADQPAAGPGFPVRVDSGLPPVPVGLSAGRGEGGRRLGAELGDGRVWVRPWDAIAAAIAGAGDDSADAATHVARIDSAITARIMAFLDTLPPDSMATAAPKPWVAKIGDQTWGVDGQWIYLGNLKLPTAILALLPLPQGNYEQAQKAAEMQRIRLDILQAARRAESAAQFRKYVEETRQRRDAEREAARNQRTKPDSIKT